jgi:hypothetical protein
MRNGDARTKGLDPNLRWGGRESLLEGNFGEVIRQNPSYTGALSRLEGSLSADGGALNIRS